MKTSIAQLNYTIGDFEGNANKIITAIKESIASKSKLVVFSELSISGYPPEDFLDYSWFIAKEQAYLKKVASYCIGITAIVGSVSVNSGKGRKLYNSACIKRWEN